MTKPRGGGSQAPGSGATPDCAKSTKKPTTVQQLDKELKNTREELQSTIEEMECVNEELKVAKEEIMSMNVALSRVNSQLKDKVRQLELCSDERALELQRKTEELQVLADNVPSQYSYVDAGEVYRYVNRQYERFFKVPADQIVGSTVRENLGSDNYTNIEPYIRKVLAGSPQRYEQEFAFPEGLRVMDVIYEPDRRKDGNIQGFFVLVHDITELKQLERQLSASRAYLAAIIDAAADGIITLDGHGIVKEFNPAAEHMFGCPADSIIGQDVRTILGVTCQGCQDYPSCFLVGHCRQTRVHAKELIGRRRDGSEFPMEFMATQVDEHDLYVAIFHDISERLRLERDVIDAATQEQTRMGREIHDGIGQQLTAIAMLAGSVRKKLDTTGHAGEAAEIGKLMQHLRVTIDEAHSLALGLAPVDIYPEGLSDAFNNLANNIREIGDIECRYHNTEEIRVHDRDIAVHLYRIAQEAVNNALKHATPHRIDIHLVHADHALELSIQDDGKGMPLPASQDGRLGLHLMRYRADIIGGELRIESSDDTGTRVSCIIPMR